GGVGEFPALARDDPVVRADGEELVVAGRAGGKHALAVLVRRAGGPGADVVHDGLRRGGKLRIADFRQTGQVTAGVRAAAVDVDHLEGGVVVAGVGVLAGLAGGGPAATESADQTPQTRVPGRTTRGARRRDQGWAISDP